MGATDSEAGNSPASERSFGSPGLLRAEISALRTTLLGAASASAVEDGEQLMGQLEEALQQSERLSAVMGDEEAATRTWLQAVQQEVADAKEAAAQSAAQLASTTEELEAARAEALQLRSAANEARKMGKRSNSLQKQLDTAREQKRAAAEAEADARRQVRVLADAPCWRWNPG